MIILLAITSYVKPAGLVAISKRGEKNQAQTKKKGRGKKGENLRGGEKEGKEREKKRERSVTNEGRKEEKRGRIG